jgi:tetratricopeptide (TPR) repeat protein
MRSPLPSLSGSRLRRSLHSAKLCLVVSLGLQAGLPGAQVAEPAHSGAGVVVETIPVGDTLGRSGVRPGDLIRSWERLGSPPANPRPAFGDLDSPFDWEWMVVEQSMRGTLILSGERAGRPIRWTVPLGALEDTQVRPVLPVAALERYERGRALSRAKETADAANVWREMADELLRKGDWRGAAWLSLRVARSWSEARNWGATEAAIEKALGAVRDPRSLVSVLESGTELRQWQGRLGEAERYTSTELRLKESVWGESLEVAQSQLQLGWLLHRQGRPAPAVDFMKRALETQQRLAPGSKAVTTSLLYLGIAAADRGELEAAERYYREALPISRQLAPESPSYTSLLNNLAEVYARRSDRDPAEELLREALQQEETTRGGGRTAAIVLGNLGSLARDRGETKSAEELDLRSLRLLERLAPTSLDLSPVLEDLGALAFERGDLGAAEGYLRSALGIQQRLLPASVGRAALLERLAEIGVRRNELRQAERYCRESLALSDRLAPGSSTRAEALHLLAAILRRKGETAEAARQLDRSVAILEDQVGQLGGSAEVKGAFRGAEGEIYRDAVQLTVERDRPREAFHLLEQFRAQAFLSLLAQRDLTFAAGVLPAFDRERRDLIARYDENEIRRATLDPDRDLGTADALRREQTRLRERREEIDAQLRRTAPEVEASARSRALGSSRHGRPSTPGRSCCPSRSARTRRSSSSWRPARSSPSSGCRSGARRCSARSSACAGWSTRQEPGRFSDRRGSNGPAAISMISWCGRPSRGSLPRSGSSSSPTGRSTCCRSPPYGEIGHRSVRRPEEPGT